MDASVTLPSIPAAVKAVYDAYPASARERLLKPYGALDGERPLAWQEQLHGELAWNRPEVSEFAAITLVMELPEALGNLLQAVQS